MFSICHAYGMEFKETSLFKIANIEHGQVLTLKHVYNENYEIRFENDDLKFDHLKLFTINSKGGIEHMGKVLGFCEDTGKCILGESNNGQLFIQQIKNQGRRQCYFIKGSNIGRFLNVDNAFTTHSWHNVSLQDSDGNGWDWDWSKHRTFSLHEYSPKSVSEKYKLGKIYFDKRDFEKSIKYLKASYLAGYKQREISETLLSSVDFINYKISGIKNVSITSKDFYIKVRGKFIKNGYEIPINNEDILIEFTKKSWCWCCGKYESIDISDIIKKVLQKNPFIDECSWDDLRGFSVTFKKNTITITNIKGFLYKQAVILAEAINNNSRELNNTVRDANSTAQGFKQVMSNFSIWKYT